MKIKRLAIKGVPAFPGSIDLPIGSITAGVIAIVGPNGKGKTTVIEGLAPVPLYRTCPSRGREARDRDPIRLARERDSRFILEYETDGFYRATLSMDGAKGDTDALLEELNADGSTRRRINNGQRSTFDAEIAQRFPSFDVFRYSVFAPQGQGDAFDRAKPSEKKTVFAEFLALGSYQVRSDAAKAAGDACEAERDRLLMLRERTASDASTAVRIFIEQLADEWQSKGGTAEARKRVLQGTIADLEARAAALQDTSAAYTLATSQVINIEHELADLKKRLAGLVDVRATVLRAGLVETSGIASRRDETIKDLLERIDGNKVLLARAEEIRAGVTELAIAETALDIARAAERGGQSQRDTAGKQLAAAEKDLAAFVAPQKDLERATSDAQLLTTVPCHGEGAYAACGFLVNATKAAAEIEALTAKLTGAAAALVTRDAIAARIPNLDLALQAVRKDIEALERHRTAQKALADDVPFLAEAEAKVAAHTAKIDDATAEAARQIAEANARIQARTAELDKEILNVSGHRDAVQAKLAAAQLYLDDVAADNSQAADLAKQLGTARGEWDTVTAAIAAAVHGHEDVARRREVYAAALADLQRLNEQIALVNVELLEWRELAKALGRGGLPDLEIDHAGPDISARANALITACFGPRFTLQLVTQVPKADGGMKDEFSVQVLDNEDPRGDWRPLGTLSGGEKVIVQEALMLAISMHVNEKSETPLRTLFRDETGSALDDENALLYVRMLQKAREIGGFHHVYFISHNKAAAALADAQIRVGNGQASIAFAPFDEVAA